MNPLRNVDHVVQTLRSQLSEQGFSVDLEKAREIVAKQFGFAGWTMFCAEMQKDELPADPNAAGLKPAIPILRIFSQDKAEEFYFGFLGFEKDWEHRFTPESPLYMQISRDDLVLHLSEHHGDACPGSGLFLRARDLERFHQELSGKDCPYARLGLENVAWGLEVAIKDPFGNSLRFCEQRAG